MLAGLPSHQVISRWNYSFLACFIPQLFSEFSGLKGANESHMFATEQIVAVFFMENGNGDRNSDRKWKWFYS